MQLNYIKIQDGMLKWKQIEQNLGMTFFRYKQRRIRVYQKK